MNSSRQLIFFVTTVLLLAILSLVTACQTLDEKPRQQAPSHNHPLVGEIWDTRAQRVVTREALLQHAVEARYVLLGEMHDNEEHHRIQAEILKALLAKGKRSILAMEQFDTEYQAAIDKSLAEPGVTANTLAEAGRFDRKGWNWSFYEPLITIALEAKAPIAAMNLARPSARNISNLGVQALGDERVTQLAFNAAWNHQRDQTLRREIIDGHCGSVPEGLLPKLIAAQRARDATMADVMINRTASDVVAILGRGHARKDIGVPVYLANRTSAAPIVSIGLTEIDSNTNDFSDYLPRDIAQRFDYIWLTSATQREDPCKGFSLPTSR